MTSPFVRFATVGSAFLLLLFAGCKPEDDVRTYTVPKRTQPTQAIANSDPTAAKERTLGAIIPLDEKYSLFVKLRGPIDGVAPLEADFDAFVGSIKVSGADKPPTWTAPAVATWREGPAKPGLRSVTFQTGSVEKPIEMYLSAPFGGTLLENVNRWRGELGLRDVKVDELKDVTKEVPLGTVKAYRVDFKGPGGKGGMMPPFAGK